MTTDITAWQYQYMISIIKYLARNLGLTSAMKTLLVNVHRAETERSILAKQNLETLCAILTPLIGWNSTEIRHTLSKIYLNYIISLDQNAVHDQLSIILARESNYRYARTVSKLEGHRVLEPTGDRLKILIVSGMFPSPMHGGGLRLLDIISSLSANHQIDLYTIYNENTDESSLANIKKLVRDLRLDGLSDVDFMKWMSGRNIEPRYYDVIDFQYLNTVPLIPKIKHYGKRSVFTMVECISRRYLIDFTMNFKDNAETAADNLIEFLRTCCLEKNALMVCDDGVAVTDDDAGFMRHLGLEGIHVIPTCVSKSFILDHVDGKHGDRNIMPNTVGFFGYYNHYPNVDGLRWYFQNVHEKIVNEIPDYTFHVFGFGDLAAIRGEYCDDKSIIYVGKVDNIVRSLEPMQILVAPLINGAGIRGKINQYSAVGRPTVSTSIGVSGMKYLNGKSIVVADHPADFANSIINLLRNKELWNRIRDGAKDVIDKYYNWDKEVPRLEELYRGNL
ncbi:MAG: glycosyltransferase family 4 protein [SAR324 cluster bacterium]|nr:glycosyltransferase family 4 protein [SAR324 cluster bacterium]